MTLPVESPPPTAPGERSSPPLVAGDSLLAVLDQQSREHGFGLLYHGSDSELSLLEPRIPLWRVGGVEIPDSDIPVVCASSDPHIAVFMALRPRDSWAATLHLGEGRVGFFTKPETLPRFEQAVGYIAVFAHDDSFVPGPSEPPITGWSTRGRLLEYRSPYEKRPICNVRVTWEDFTKMLTGRLDAELILVDHPADSREY